jgi:hypothetical protein
MTVEEYINKIDTKPFHYACRDCANINIKNFARRASCMARKEELEKAQMAFEDAISLLADITPCKKITEAIDEFTKLLNE